MLCDDGRVPCVNDTVDFDKKNIDAFVIRVAG